MKSEYLEAFDSYVEKNNSFNDISNLIQNDKRLISLKKINEQIGKTKDTSDYWSKFYETAPEACGRLNVSNIGLNVANNIAVIEIKFYKSGMNGYVNYLVFGKNDNKWEVVDVLQTVIS